MNEVFTKNITLKEAMTMEDQEEEIAIVLKAYGVTAKSYYPGAHIFVEDGIAADDGRLAYLASFAGEMGIDGISERHFYMTLTERMAELPEIGSLQKQIAEVKACLDELEEIHPDLVCTEWFPVPDNG